MLAIWIGGWIQYKPFLTCLFRLEWGICYAGVLKQKAQHIRVHVIPFSCCYCWKSYSTNMHALLRFGYQNCPTNSYTYVCVAPHGDRITRLMYIHECMFNGCHNCSETSMVVKYTIYNLETQILYNFLFQYTVFWPWHTDFKHAVLVNNSILSLFLSLFSLLPLSFCRCMMLVPLYRSILVVWTR